jgi:hypothetical protein
MAGPRLNGTFQENNSQKESAGLLPGPRLRYTVETLTGVLSRHCRAEVNRCSAARTQIGVRVPSVASSRMRSQLPSKRRRTLSVLASRGYYQRSARCRAWSSSTPEDRPPHPDSHPSETARDPLDSWVTGTRALSRCPWP